MHELSIAQSIAEAVAERATACNATSVKSIRLKIGEASGIVTDSLTFSFEMIASLEPILADAQLVIETMPHHAHCRHCATDFTIINHIAQCPTCQQWSSDIISGTELQIIDMEIVS